MYPWETHKEVINNVIFLMFRSLPDLKSISNSIDTKLVSYTIDFFFFQIWIIFLASTKP